MGETKVIIKTAHGTITLYPESIELLGARRYRKKPVEVMAVRMENDFDVETLEGRMSGRKGDYLVRGEKGELYPVKRYVFESTYKEVR